MWESKEESLYNGTHRSLDWRADVKAEIWMIKSYSMRVREKSIPGKGMILCKITEARTTWCIQRAEQRPAWLEPNEWNLKWYKWDKSHKLEPDHGTLCHPIWEVYISFSLW